MKITDLNMYGDKVKTFLATIEEYDTRDVDMMLKTKIKIKVHNTLDVLGYSKDKINCSDDIQIIDFKRTDQENSILCTMNILLIK